MPRGIKRRHRPKASPGQKPVKQKKPKKRARTAAKKAPAGAAPLTIAKNASPKPLGAAALAASAAASAGSGGASASAGSAASPAVLLKKTHTSTQIHAYDLSDSSVDSFLFGVSGRSSAIGKQGDHTSAYALFEHTMKNIVKRCDEKKGDKSIKKMLKEVRILIDSIPEKKEEKEALTNYLSKQYETIRGDGGLGSEKYIKEHENELKIAGISDSRKTKLRRLISNEKLAYRARIDSLIKPMVKFYLSHRNQQQYTCFPTEGNIRPPDGEGDRVKTAIKSLSEKNTKFSKLNDAQKMSEIPSISKEICQLLWYPKIPDGDLMPPSEFEKIRKEKKYVEATKVRNNEPSVLAKVLSNHFALILFCFPEFRKAGPDFRGRLRDTFVRRMVGSKYLVIEKTNAAKKGKKKAKKILKEVGYPELGWNLSIKERRSILKKVKTNVEQDYPTANRTDSEHSDGSFKSKLGV